MITVQNNFSILQNMFFNFWFFISRKSTGNPEISLVYTPEGGDGGFPLK